MTVCSDLSKIYETAEGALQREGKSLHLLSIRRYAQRFTSPVGDKTFNWKSTAYTNELLLPMATTLPYLTKLKTVWTFLKFDWPQKIVCLIGCLAFFFFLYLKYF